MPSGSRTAASNAAHESPASFGTAPQDGASHPPCLYIMAQISQGQSVCLAVGQWRALLTALQCLCSIFSTCTFIGIACLLVAATTYIVGHDLTTVPK